MIDFNNITPLGAGLKIAINCNYELSHDWMAFASWYSINKTLPDAQVKIFCERGICDYQIFNWPNRCCVDFSFTKDDEEYFEITPDVMAVSAFDVDNLGPIDCRKNFSKTFVSFQNGCGLYDFINHDKRCPFVCALSLFSDSLSLNEYRILKIWDKANMPYISVAY